MAVLGFAGLAVRETGLSFNPQLPGSWHSLAFNVQWQGRHLSVSIDSTTRTLAATMTIGDPMIITLNDDQHLLSTKAPLAVRFLNESGTATPSELGMTRTTAPRWRDGLEHIPL